MIHEKKNTIGVHSGIRKYTNKDDSQFKKQLLIKFSSVNPHPSIINCQSKSTSHLVTIQFNCCQAVIFLLKSG